MNVGKIEEQPMSHANSTLLIIFFTCINFVRFYQNREVRAIGGATDESCEEIWVVRNSI